MNIVTFFIGEWAHLSAHIKRIEDKIKAYSQQQKSRQRLMSIPDMGIMNATAILAAVGDARHIETVLLLQAECLAKSTGLILALTIKQHNYKNSEDI